MGDERITPNTRATAERLKATADGLAPFVSRDTMSRFRSLLADALDMAYERDAEIEALRSAVRTLNGTMVGDFFFATYLSPIELAAMRRALNDRSNQEGDR